MDIVLKRTKRSRFAVDGFITINGQRICDTTENVKNCLACATYRISLRQMPFRVGNGVHTLKKGHILVGEALVPGVVIHSLQHYDRLYERIKKASQRGTEILLTILQD